ncbi:3'-5' exonuclease [Pseudidiomarina sp. WS423]|uniref:3'-5' exonuclease n=1 Tax=Pseudidiomarina sp. WS423 TaxID=3425124 RepID=UPI003D6DD7D1
MAANASGWRNRIAAWWHRRQALAQPWTAQRYVALDLETSGLDARHDNIIAVAWVELTPPLLDYQSARYYTVATAQTELNQSPVVHGLVSRDLKQVTPLAEVLKELQQVLDGAVLVCHHVQLDWAFLKQAGKAHQVRFKPLLRFDTLTFEGQRLKNSQHHIQRGSLTLSACRSRYGLPQYDAHHALSDAIACGELMLAQLYKYAGAQVVRLPRS